MVDSISWFFAGTRLSARLDLGFKVRVPIYYHTVFPGCSVGSAVVLCGYQGLEIVEAVHYLETVCGNLCRSATGQAMVGCCFQVGDSMSAVLRSDLGPRLLLLTTGGFMPVLTWNMGVGTLDVHLA